MKPHRRPLLRILAATAAVLAGCSGALALAAASAASKPPLPPARPVSYDPDPATCQPAALQSGFQQQLLPWADQAVAVQARLRQLQLEMLQASLQRCVSKGLLSPEAAGNLERSLGQGEAEAVQPSGARP